MKDLMGSSAIKNVNKHQNTKKMIYKVQPSGWQMRVRKKELKALLDTKILFYQLNAKYHIVFL